MNIDPVFTSLLVLERRLVEYRQMLLHCAYVVYKGETILFSAPSETGKATQTNFCSRFRDRRTVNGDGALLGRKDGLYEEDDL